MARAKSNRYQSRPGRTYGRRKRAYKPRVPRRRNPRNILTTTRMYEGTSVTASNAGALAQAYSFNLNSLPNVTELSNLFDQYRINAISFTMIPNVTGNDMNPVSTYYEMPNVHSVIDFDDDAAPAAVTELMQYPSYRRTRGTQIHTRYFKPCIAQTIYKTGATTGTSQRRAWWLDLADTTVPHFGLKIYIDVTNAATNIKYRIYVKYYLQCKGVR